MTARKPLVQNGGIIEQLQSGDTLSIPLADTHILVGNGSGLAADVAMSNDATISDLGAVTLKNTGPGVTSATNASVTIDAQGRVTALSSGSPSSSAITQTNGNASPIVIGTPVYSNGAADTVDQAQATTLAKASVIGLVKDTTINASASGSIQLSGVLTATTGQWNAIKGGSGGLAPGARYFLDDSAPGLLTTTAPSTVTHFAAQIGIALSTTELLIQINSVIEL